MDKGSQNGRGRFERAKTVCRGRTWLALVVLALLFSSFAVLASSAGWSPLDATAEPLLWTTESDESTADDEQAAAEQAAQAAQEAAEQAAQAAQEAAEQAAQAAEEQASQAAQEAEAQETQGTEFFMELGSTSTTPAPITDGLHRSTAFMQGTELCRVVEEDIDLGLPTSAGHSPITVYNDSTITNRDVLFLQSEDGLTLTDYHEDMFCAPLADFLGGDFVAFYGFDFAAAITDGATLTNYGTIVVNTHGNSTNSDPREDGGWRGWLLIKEDCPKEFFDAMVAQYGYEVETSEPGFRLSFDSITNKMKGAKVYEVPDMVVLNSSGQLWVSTDFIMERYADARFDNAVFYFAVCYLLRDEVFVQFLFDHGAQGVIGCTEKFVNVIDRDFCKSLGAKLCTTVPGADWRCYSYDEVFEDEGWTQHSYENKLWTTYVRPIFPNGRFVCWGKGDLYGRVECADGGVPKARIALWRYVNHRLEPAGGTEADLNGMFEFRGLTWGTYVALVTATFPDGQVVKTAAQVNFGDRDAVCGSIYVEAPQGTTVTETSDPVDEGDGARVPPADTRKTLETYLKSVLWGEYHLMETGERAYSTETTTSDGAIQAVIDDIDGILGAYIYDLDADGELEMIVVRYEVGSTTHEYFGEVPSTLMVVEIYEVYADGVGVSARADYVTRCFGQKYNDTRTAVFLGGQSPVNDGAPLIFVYASNCLDDNNETVRCMAYNGEALVGVAADAVWGASEWSSRYAGTQACYGITGINELVRTADAPGDGWEELERTTIDESYSDEAYQTLLAEQTRIFDAHRAVLSERGAIRTSERFFFELKDLMSPEKIGVQTVFSNADELTWITELDCVVSYVNGVDEKVLVARDFTGVARP